MSAATAEPGRNGRASDRIGRYGGVPPFVDPDEVEQKAGEGLLKPERLTFDSLLGDFPERRPEIIEGLLRCGEIMNLIASPKLGKSWLVYCLLAALVSGAKWLGFPVKKGRALLLDNELHPEEIAYRLRQVSRAFNLDPDEVNSRLIVEPLRGKQADINAISSFLAAYYADETFDLIVFDAFYRILPKGVSENDNADMTSIYNSLDAIAKMTGAALVGVHHTSKGDQTQKDTTDVGAGAGAMTRATDTHLILRPHKCEDCAVIDMVKRSNAQSPSLTAKFEFPRWIPLEGVEPELKTTKGQGDRKQDAKDTEAEEVVLQILEDADGEWLSRSTIRRRSPFGQGRVDRALVRLDETIEMKIDTNPRNRNEDIEFYRIDPADQTSEQ